MRAATVGAGSAALLAASPARASGSAEAQLLSCMDYRLVDDLTRYMDSRGLTDRYDHVVLAGASAGATHVKFMDWHATFWGHLQVAIDLHKIHRVIIIDHRDCGAFKIAFGNEHASDPEVEAAVHGAVLGRLAREIKAKHPGLAIETLLMSVDGSVTAVSASGSCEPEKTAANEHAPEEESQQEVADAQESHALDVGGLFPEQ